MVSKARAERVADRIAEELAILLQQEVNDPRLKMVTVTGVDVDRELAYATAYVSSMDAEQGMDEVLHALDSAGGFLRSKLAAKIQLRSFPQLRFRQDSSSNKGARIEELLQMLDEERRGGVEDQEA